MQNQNDIEALIDTAEIIELSKPCFILSPSMVGCVALRAVYWKLGFISVTYIGPMWGIIIKKHY